MSRALLADLPAGAVFEVPTGYSAYHRYRVVKPARESAEGFVDVWDLSMTADDERARVDRGDREPRAGFFTPSQRTEVEVISQ